MSLKDKATAAAIIGNASTFQVTQKVRAVVFPPPLSPPPPPGLPVSASDENKRLQGFQSSSFVFAAARTEGQALGEGSISWTYLFLKVQGRKTQSRLLWSDTGNTGFYQPSRFFSVSSGSRGTMKSCPLTPHKGLLFSTECIFLKIKTIQKKIPFAFFMEDPTICELSESRAFVLNLGWFCPLLQRTFGNIWSHFWLSQL